MNSINKLIKEYQKNGNKPINFCFKDAYFELPQIKKENNGYHYIHYYPGRIYPYIPRCLLLLSEFREVDGVLLDPFAGGGTILLESLINPFAKKRVLGVEINPVGRLISKVKTHPFEIHLASKYMKELNELYTQNVSAKIFIPSYENIEMWFSKQAITKLSKLRFSIEKLDAPKDIKDFFWLCFSSIIRKVSNADPYIPPPVLLKLEKYEQTAKYNKLKMHLKIAENPDLWRIFEESVSQNIKKLDIIFKLINDNKKNTRADIIWDDARKIRMGMLEERGIIDKTNANPLLANKVDIVFTSPPYLTAQKYIRTFKLELLWLGFDIEEIRRIDKTSIGTENISSVREVKELGLKSIDRLVEETFQKSKARAFMVYDYFKNMIEMINETYRVLKDGGYFVLVVGNNKVLRKQINTYRLLTEIATTNGFEEILTLKDKIRSRSMLTKRNGSGGLIKNEYVVILRKEE